MEAILKFSQMEFENIFNLLIIYSIIWSVGSNFFDKTLNKSKSKLSQLIKSKILRIYINFPLEGEIFDYFIDFKNVKFSNWQNLLGK